MSTSSCERGFATACSLRQGQSDDVHVSREEDILQIQSDDDPKEHNNLVKTAMTIWATVYGNARDGNDHSIRRGVPQLKGLGDGHAAFLRVRRAASDLLLKRPLPGPVDILEEDIVFNEKHQRELDERAKKCHKRKVDALKVGHFGDLEIDDILVQSAMDTVGKERIRARDAAAAKRRN